jgi:hypothetical protein
MDGMPVSCVLNAVSDLDCVSVWFGYAITNNCHYVSYWFRTASGVSPCRQ